MADVLVIGGGAIGASIAYELASRGAQVTVLERGPELGGGCSSGNAGLISPSHAAPLTSPHALRQGLGWAFRRDSPLYLKPRPAVVPWLTRFLLAATHAQATRANEVLRSLSVRSLAMHAELAAKLDTGFERNGLLNVYETDHGFEFGCAEARVNQAAGRRPEVLSGDEARTLEPTLAKSLAGAVYYPDDAHCEPGRFVSAVGRAALELGATIRTGVEVIGIGGRGGRIDRVETTAGVETADEVVVAAGAWSRELTRRLAVRMPVEGGKGYHVELEPPPSTPRVPIMLHEPRVVVTPLPGRLRVAGTLELAGLDMAVDRVRLAAILRAAARGVPSVTGARVRGIWRGLRPCAPDGLPIVGRTARYDNLILATGHAMLGLTLAPWTGAFVADLVLDGTASAGAGEVSPDRFSSMGAALKRMFG